MHEYLPLFFLLNLLNVKHFFERKVYLSSFFKEDTPPCAVYQEENSFSSCCPAGGRLFCRDLPSPEVETCDTGDILCCPPEGTVFCSYSPLGECWNWMCCPSGGTVYISLCQATSGKTWEDCINWGDYSRSCCPSGKTVCEPFCEGISFDFPTLDCYVSCT